MGKRTCCILKNQILVEAMETLRVELHKDFSETLLEKCDNCSAGLSEIDSKEVHNRLICIFNDIYKIKDILSAQ
ncbi:MAG: hypothetical protein P9X22_02155 [Candidatus Zapsychrus exili]|nr:hypothetical protein [Candidatus Zapsychrus exili]